MKKTDLLEAFKSIQKDIGPKKVMSVAKKDVLVDAMKGTVKPKNDNTETILANITKNAKAKMESVWKPTVTSVSDLSGRFLMEAELAGKRQPNAFRLNLQPIVMNTTHAKFGATRGDKSAIVELLYPNANEKITVKIQVDGAEDKLEEIGLEDDAYRTNFGEYIIKLIDQSIAESRKADQSAFDDYTYRGNVNPTEKNVPEAPMGTVHARGSDSSISVGGPVWESDRRTMNELLFLIEADDKEKLGDEDDEDTGDAGDAGDIGDLGDLGGETGESGEPGDAGSDAFGGDDFAIDAGAETEVGGLDDLGGGGGGGGGGLGDLGGGGGLGDLGGGEKDAGDINAEGGPAGEDVEYMTFRDKTDWLQSSLDTMQNLTAQAMGQKMQEGKGVLLTSDEIMNGTAGLRNVDKPVDIVDKFLKIYTELDEIDLKEEDLTAIEQKLSLNDNQFDAWITQKLPEFTGESDVNETLDNSMFDDFAPMGGEEEPAMGTEGGTEGDFQDFLEETAPEETETPGERKEASLDLGLGPELEEFPEIREEETEKEPGETGEDAGKSPEEEKPKE